METLGPPVAPPESAPKKNAAPLRLRTPNVFELFKKIDSPEVNIPRPREAEAIENPVLSARRRRLALEVMRIIKGEAPQPTQSAEALWQPLAQQAAQEGVATAVVEVTPKPYLIERAKGIGRNVLNLVQRVRSDVVDADIREAVPVPTDITPLAEADSDVRSAMRELIAPIEQYQAQHPQPKEQLSAAAELSPETQEPTIGFEANEPLVQNYETAVTAAVSIAKEAVETKERFRQGVTLVRKVGLFALGAATVGGFAYTWHRMRQLKKEQRAQRREHKKFEAEVRAIQTEQEQQLHTLQQKNAVSMAQTQRQEYVEQVSQFAHQQAVEIRTVARAAEVMQTQTAVQERHPTSQPVRRVETMPATTATIENPQPAIVKKEKLAPAPEHHTFTERVNHTLGKAKQAGGGVAGGVAAVGNRLQQAFSASPSKVNQVQQLRQGTAPVKTIQGWPLMTAFAASVIVFLVTLFGAW
ncbi:MAG TPA: hypothetical protein VFO38_04425 [Candidatus Saccharimonadales bacterium]|nr:hypothetical protein [Candidatus Saccharimonadales bacterium]